MINKHRNFSILTVCFSNRKPLYSRVLSAGLIELAIKNNTMIGGDDFKSGQTKMKSVLVDFLVGAGIKVAIQKIYIYFMVVANPFLKSKMYIL